MFLEEELEVFFFLQDSNSVLCLWSIYSSPIRAHGLYVLIALCHKTFAQDVHLDMKWFSMNSVFIKETWIRSYRVCAHCFSGHNESHLLKQRGLLPGFLHQSADADQTLCVRREGPLAGHGENARLPAEELPAACFILRFRINSECRNL